MLSKIQTLVSGSLMLGKITVVNIHATILIINTYLIIYKQNYLE